MRPAFPWRADFDQPSMAEHRDAVGDLGGERDVVADEQKRHAVLFGQAPISAYDLRCTIVSSALVASSAISSPGLPAIAAAIATRCFWPPESWCG